MKKGLVYLLALFTCFALVGCDKKETGKTGEDNKGNVIDNGGENNQTNPDNGNTNPIEDNGIQSVSLKNESKDLTLSKDHEIFKFNNLTLEFFGEDASKDTGVKGSYKYVLTLNLGGVEINSNIYSDPFKRVINSSNLSSNFTIYAVDNVYILKSTTGTQRDGEYALFIDNVGNFIESFEDVSLKIDVAKKTVDYENCITDNPEEVCRKSSYKIANNTLK